MAAALTINVDGSNLPGGVISLKRSDELLWSEGTGRAASDGKMVGSVVAPKQTYAITWGIIPADTYNSIRSGIPSGFFPLKISVNGSQIANITAYRSNIQGEFVGKFGGAAYWKDVTVELIER